MRVPGISAELRAETPIYNGSHFSWGEATKNGLRIPCQTTFEGIIIPGAQITANIVKIAKELDKIRNYYDRPIIVTSWYRDPRSNRSVGGVRNSQHLLGWAADIQVQGVPPYRVAAYLEDSWPGGLGDSDAFTHLDLRHLMGWSAARWDYGNA
jgi:zinc D-Ala-D-Ala carboxypeptidase